MGKALIVATMLALAGCTTVPVEDPREAWCAHNKPRRDATETTPRAELDEINSHNAKGVAWCHWKA